MGEPMATKTSFASDVNGVLLDIEKVLTARDVAGHVQAAA